MIKFVNPFNNLMFMHCQKMQYTVCFTSYKCIVKSTITN